MGGGACGNQNVWSSKGDGAEFWVGAHGGTLGIHMRGRVKGGGGWGGGGGFGRREGKGRGEGRRGERERDEERWGQGERWENGNSAHIIGVVGSSESFS